MAIQQGTQQAMTDALVKHDMLAGSSKGGKAAPARKNGWRMHRQEHAVFVMHILAARRRAMGMYKSQLFYDPP